MIRLDDISAGLALTGIEPSVVVTVVSVIRIAEGAVQVIYRTPEGALKERLLNRADEVNRTITASIFSPAWSGSCRRTRVDWNDLAYSPPAKMRSAVVSTIGPPTSVSLITTKPHAAQKGGG